jgi:hypothetical protein
MKYEVDVNRGEFFATDTTTNLVYKHEVELNVYGANESDVFVSSDEGETFVKCNDLPEWWGEFDDWCVEYSIAQREEEILASQMGA